MSNDELEYCANCGDELPDHVWCPVVTATTDDGTPLIRSFCDDTCKAEWLDDR